MTAEELTATPAPLAALVDAVVPVPALRERSEDVMPLARYAARQTRMRDVDFTPCRRTGTHQVWVAPDESER